MQMTSFHDDALAFFDALAELIVKALTHEVRLRGVLGDKIGRREIAAKDGGVIMRGGITEDMVEIVSDPMSERRTLAQSKKNIPN